MIIGVDVGAKGGIVLLSSRTKIELMEVTPLIADSLDFNELDRIFERFVGFCFDQLGTKPICYIEKVAAMPKQGVSSMFTFGKTYGATIMAAMRHCASVNYILPKEWQKKAFASIVTKNKDYSPKEKAAVATSSLFPNDTFLLTQRSKRKHGGLVDAALIAYSGFFMESRKE